MEPILVILHIIAACVWAAPILIMERSHSRIIGMFTGLFRRPEEES